MARARLQWSEKDPPIDISSRADLEKHLLNLAARAAARPLLVVITLPNGSSGYIGLGRPESILFFHDPQGPDGWTREWIPVGDEFRSGFIEFFLLGQHHSEFENRSLLPVDDAIRAIVEFFDTGSKPGWITWEQNTF